MCGRLRVVVGTRKDEDWDYGTVVLSKSPHPAQPKTQQGRILQAGLSNLQRPDHKRWYAKRRVGPLRGTQKLHTG